MLDDLYKTRCSRCRNQQSDFRSFSKIDHHCKCNMPQFPIEDDSPCENFDSKFIEYPLTINGIENNFARDIEFSLHNCGTLVRVSPCGKEYQGKTYLGVMLGDLPIGTHISHSRDTGILSVGAMTNPAIFVPELRKIIYGCESWWGKIESVDDFKEITQEDIDNTWYVKLLKDMSATKEGE